MKRLPLSEERIRAALRAGVRGTTSHQPTVMPTASAVGDLSRARAILMGKPVEPALQRRRHAGDPPVISPEEEIALVHRMRDEILENDPYLAQRLRDLPTPPAPSPIAPTAPRGAIAYATRKGKPHGLRVKTTAQAWQKIANFYGSCTDADPMAPGSAMLMLDGDAAARPAVAAALSRLRATIGEGTRSESLGLGALFPGLSEIAAESPLGPLITGGVQHRWTLSRGQLEAALAVLFAGDPWPQSLMPQTLLSIGHSFRWTGTGREGVATPESFAVTQLGAANAMMPHYAFPFESPDAEFLAYLDRIRKFMPFKMSAKNFRLLQPTGKRGTLVARLFDTSEIARLLG